jgi:hypothetical protein
MAAVESLLREKVGTDDDVTSGVISAYGFWRFSAEVNFWHFRGL